MKSGRPGDLGPREPGLDQLINALTAGPAPDELAGEPAALAMFRASLPKAAAAHAAPHAAAPHAAAPHAAAPKAAAPKTAAPQAAAPPRRPRRRVSRLAGAVALALAGGLAGAAYAAVLPAPVQHAAYRVAGLVGVPDAHHLAPRPIRPSSALPSAGHSTSPAPARPSPSASPGPARSASPSPRPARSASPAPRPSTTRSAAPPLAAQLSLTAAQHRITAGGSGNLTALLTDQQGRGVPGQQLTLLERAAGQPSWRPAGQATTGSDGSAVLTVQNLIANVSVRLSGPDGTRSQRVRLIAVPPLSVTVASGPQPRADTLTASSPLAVPGDLAVLQVQVGGAWRSLRTHQLSQADQATFAVKLRRIQRVYRVALLRTATHGRSASSPVAIPPGSP